MYSKLSRFYSYVSIQFWAFIGVWVQVLCLGLDLGLGSGASIHNMGLGFGTLWKYGSNQTWPFSIHVHLQVDPNSSNY